MTPGPDDHIATEVELLDVLAPDGTIIGTADRDEVHRLGLWHRTFHCLAVRTAPPTSVILQRRHHLSAFPLRIDLTGSGHLEAGEQPLDGVRELEEEAGIVADPDSLVPLGVHYLVDDGPDCRNREQIHVFLYPTDVPLTDLRPSTQEVCGLLEAPVDGLLALLDRGRPNTTAVEAVEMPVGESPRPATLTIDDLVPENHGYLIKVLIMAERLSLGLTPLAV